MDCQDVCINQERSCHALKLATSEIASAATDSMEAELMKEFSDILAMFVDPYTMCGAAPKSKYGQRLFLGLDKKLGCKVCGMGTKFLCNTIFKGDTATKISNAIGGAAKKLCIAMKIPVLIEKIKILGDFDACGKVEEFAKGLLPKIVAPQFCDKTKASGICGKLFEGCKVE
ncbi:unnamed protein product [Cylicocyclus nassatus]|uniref:Uncharacterized protein n=1 Tax=Cylicocyclus nassatus TaxID=53992 RepID=A0AA36M1J8_CYLNA|nr:unnamed protein product [Cylicocyclus nassatus]